MDKKTTINALSALAQEHRLDIFRLLVQSGPDGRNVGQIADQLDLAHSTLSFHLDKLAKADLIVPTKQGRQKFYAVNYSIFTDMIKYLTENCCDQGEMNCRIDIIEQP